MLISDRIQAAVLPENPAVSDDEIQAYYDANEAQFQQPETRDVRVDPHQDRGRRQRRARRAAEGRLRRARSPTVAKKYSIDDATKSTGGLRQGVVDGQSEPALDKEIFAADRGRPRRPVQGRRRLLRDRGPEDHAGDDDLARRTRPTRSSRPWSPRASRRSPRPSRRTSRPSGSRARSAPTAIAIDRCANAEPTPSTCTAEVAESQGCPAPVPSTKPIAPGTGDRLRRRRRRRPSRRARRSRPPRCPPAAADSRPDAGSGRGAPPHDPAPHAAPRARRLARAARRARAPRRDHPPAAARVPLGPRAGRALDRPAHGRGGLRARRGGAAAATTRSSATSSATSSSRSSSCRCCSRSAAPGRSSRSPSR